MRKQKTGRAEAIGQSQSAGESSEKSTARADGHR